MANTIFLAGWEAEGLRCPDHKVSFEQPSGHLYPVSLLQMPNGTGKTTTLHLLRTTLSGAAEDPNWQSQVRGWCKRGNENGSGVFRVTLLVDGRRVTICLNLDFDQRTATYTTTVSSGMKNGYKPPQTIEKFLLPQFVNFYVFDGELAERLLDRDHTDAQTVIENLFQLSLFAEITTAIGTYYDAQTEGRGATEERGLSRRANKVQLLRTRIQELKEESAKLQKEYEQTNKALGRKKAKFESALEKQQEHGEKVHEAQLALTAAKATVERLTGDVLRRMRDPYAVVSSFGFDMMNLKTSLDRVKLPESTAREFFEELAQEDVCVCGRELNE